MPGVCTTDEAEELICDARKYADATEDGGFEMPILILARGLPGSGKSTFAASALSGFVHVEADQFMVSASGDYEFDKTRLGECHAKCLRACAAALEAGKNVVVANTFSQQWELEPYRKLATALGAVVFEIMLLGRHQNTHCVPEEVIDRMRDRWEFE